MENLGSKLESKTVENMKKTLVKGNHINKTTSKACHTFLEDLSIVEKLLGKKKFWYI